MVAETEDAIRYHCDGVHIWLDMLEWREDIYAKILNIKNKRNYEKD
jgi:hypothetical protein